MSDEPQTDAAPSDPHPTDPRPTDAPAVQPKQQAAVDVSIGALFGRLGPAAILGVLWTALPLVCGILLVVKFRAPVAEWLQGQELGTGLAIYVAVFAVTAGLGILPTVFQGLIGGYAFGLAWGLPGAVMGFTLASLIGYVVSRLVAQEKVEAEIERHVKAKAVRDALVGGSALKTLGIVTLVRVPPNSPFALTNLVLTSVRVPLWIYAIGTLVGMTPRTAAVVWLGTQISDWDNTDKPSWLVYGGIGITVVVLIVIAQIANKALEKVTQPGEPAADPSESA